LIQLIERLPSEKDRYESAEKPLETSKGNVSGTEGADDPAERFISVKENFGCL